MTIKSIEIKWLSAFIDLSADVFDKGAQFWLDATESALSPRRGDRDQFATLLPPSGDPYLRVQRTLDGSSGIHIDLHVESITDATAHAISIGAEQIADHGYSIMRTPGGLTFCFVSAGTESTPVVVGDARYPNLTDQVCIDVPAAQFEAEIVFWASLTGWTPERSKLDEYAFFAQPAHLPLRVLIQQLGTDDGRTAATAHLDISAGDQFEMVAAEHRRQGAASVGDGPYWTTLTDPAGLPYCVTRRIPRTD